jgi:hypothetical protein
MLSRWRELWGMVACGGNGMGGGERAGHEDVIVHLSALTVRSTKVRAHGIGVAHLMWATTSRPRPPFESASKQLGLNFLRMLQLRSMRRLASYCPVTPRHGARRFGLGIITGHRASHGHASRGVGCDSCGCGSISSLACPRLTVVRADCGVAVGSRNWVRSGPKYM